MKYVFTAIILILAARNDATAQDATTSPESQSPLLTADDGKTAQRAVQVLSKWHLLHPVVDDALSEKMMDRFVRSWDPQKLYFLKPDVSEFSIQKTLLDDQLLAGSVEFANTVFQRFQQRAKVRLNHIGQWIDVDHDFTVDESLTTDATQLDWAATKEELDERWRKQVKYELLLLKLKGYEVAESRFRLRRHYERTQALLNQTERFELLEQYLNSLTKSFDTHAEFLTVESMAQYNIGIIRFGSIGVRLIELDGYLVVQEIVPGGTADADGGIEAGDRLIGVADESGTEFLDVWNMKLDAVYEAIGGPLTTTVQLQILKPEGNIKVYKLKRSGNSNNVAAVNETDGTMIHRVHDVACVDRDCNNQTDKSFC